MMCESCGRAMTEACLNAWAALTMRRFTQVERDIADRCFWWPHHEEINRHE
jgi:hypothetical protein